MENRANNNENNKEKELSFRENFQVIKWVFKLIKDDDRNYIPICILKRICDLALIYLPIILIAPILSSLVNKDLKMALLYGVILTGAVLIIEIISAFLDKIKSLKYSNLDFGLRGKLDLKPMDLDYETFKDSKLREEFAKNISNFNFEVGPPPVMVNRIIDIISNSFSVFISLGLTLELILSPSKRSLVLNISAMERFKDLLITFSNPYVSILLVTVSLILVFFVRNKIVKILKDRKRGYFLNHASVEKKLAYLVMQMGMNTKDYDTFQSYGMTKIIKKNLLEENKKTIDFYNQTNFDSSIENAVNAASSSILLILSYLIGVVKVLTGAIPIANLVTYIQSFNQLNTAITTINDRVTMLRSSLPYYRELKNYLDLKNKFLTGSIPVEKRRDHDVKIEFKNVSFKYPNTEKYVLKNLNLVIDTHGKHALVGPNGSGKTSLINLLCRLYDPTEGEILLNGVNIKKYDYEEYLRLFAVVFQDFEVFPFTLGENIGSSTEYDYEKAKEAFIMAGYKKEISKETLDIDVAESSGNKEHFSGGEKQKIAIARAIYKPSSFVIMDEPTAALDPKSESEIYENLNKLIQNKTTVFISHRMSSCIFCDDIIVLEEGRLCERGSHKELLLKNGLYKTMWNAQAQYYAN